MFIEIGLDAAAVLALCVALLWGAGRVVARVQIRQAAVEAVFAGYVLMLGTAVLFPLGRFDGALAHDVAASVNLVPFASIMQLLDRPSATQAIRQIGGNVVMFIPLGLLLPALSRRFRTIGTLAVAGLVVSVGVEVVQLALRLGLLSRRSMDIDDVILNVLGTLLGYALWRAVSRLASLGRTTVDGALERA